jgi:hypothetical protein
VQACFALGRQYDPFNTASPQAFADCVVTALITDGERGTIKNRLPENCDAQRKFYGVCRPQQPMERIAHKARSGRMEVFPNEGEAQVVSSAG